MGDDEVEVFVMGGPNLPPAMKLDTKEGVVAHLVSPAYVATMKLLLPEIGVEEVEKVYVLQERKDRLYWTKLKAEHPPAKVANQIHVFYVGPSVPRSAGVSVPPSVGVPGISEFWQKLCYATTKKISVVIDTEIVTQAVEVTTCIPSPEVQNGTKVYKRRKDMDHPTPSNVTVQASILALEDGTVFPYRQTSVLMIRSVYNKFMDLVFLILKGQYKKRHLFVTGTPGTGKTFFGFYLLYKLRIDPHFARIVIIWEEGSKTGPGMSLLFYGDVVELGKPGDFDKYAKSDTIFIVNGPEPPLRALQNIGHVVLCSSTKDSIGSVWQFIKDTVIHTVYMPLWDLCELMLAGQLEERKPECVYANYAKWGGSARSVLFHYDDLEYNKRFENALTAAKEKAKIKYSVGNVLQSKESSSFILHINVLDDDCTKTAVVFASNYVREELERLRKDDDVRSIVEYVVTNLLNPEEATVVGRRFELLVHKLFSSANIGDFKFKARKLIRPGEIMETSKQNISFKLSGGYQCFHKLEDIKVGSEGYFVPDYSTYPCYDSLMLFKSGSIALQVTMDTQHHAKLKYVMTLVQNWNLQKFFFVVPQQLFDEYPYQKLLSGPYEYEWPCEVWVLGVPSDFFNFHT